MHLRAIGAVAAVVALGAAIGAAQAYDDAKYPNWRGMWYRAQPVQWDATKPPGRGQQAPLTEEYKAVHEVGLAEQRRGGQGYKPQVKCLPSGMPQMMIGYEPIEFIVTPEVTYMRMVYMHENRRVYTDGRKWPDKIEPTFAGYSIGKWIDENGDGKYDVLEVETRGFKGPRIIDIDRHPAARRQSDRDQGAHPPRPGQPRHPAGRDHHHRQCPDEALDGDAQVQARASKDRLDGIRLPRAQHTIVILREQTYFIREDGFLMPSGRDQPPPDLKYFKEQ